MHLCWTMAKRGEKERRKLSLLYFVLAAALLSILQPILIIAAVVSPVADYFSLGSLISNLVRLALVVYLGVYFFKDGLKKSALNGALMGFVSSSVLIIFAYISKQCCDIPILGIQVPQAGCWQV